MDSHFIPISIIKKHNHIKDNPSVVGIKKIHAGHGFRINFEDGQFAENSWLYPIEITKRF